MYFVSINSTDYSIIKNEQGEQAWDYINVVQNVRNQHSYMPSNTNFLAIRGYYRGVED